MHTVLSFSSKYLSITQWLDEYNYRVRGWQYFESRHVVVRWRTYGHSSVLQLCGFYKLYKRFFSAENLFATLIIRWFIYDVDRN